MHVSRSPLRVNINIKGRERMDSGKMMKMNDRLSSLPDDLIHKIFSFLRIKDAFRVSILSSRWRYIWSSMPYLNFSIDDFSTLPYTLPNFSESVTNVLSRRNNLTDVYSLKLSFRGKRSHAVVKRILNYACSHNIQQLNVVYFVENDAGFPLPLFRWHSLKHLSLTMRKGSLYHFNDRHAARYLEIPALTTLDLHSITFCEDHTADKCFGVFANLKNLTLKDCKINGISDSFDICHPRLSNLTLENSFNNVKVVNVAAPQLQNLTIKACDTKLAVSAPELASLVYKGSLPLNLSTDGFRSLKKADICASTAFHTALFDDEDAHQIVCLLQQLHSVHFLTLSLEIVELLSLHVELLLHQPSPFVNLKTLKIYPSKESWSMQEPFITMSTELKSYFLDSSPESTFTMVFREEIEAQKIMAKLGEILAEEKENTKTNTAHLEQQKAQMGQSHKPKKLKIGGNMGQIKSYRENVGVQIDGRKEKVCLIISDLMRMEQILKRLPASNRAKIQPCFYSLSAEAGIAISKITDCIKIQFDENQSCSSVCSHKLVTTMEPSS